MLVPADEVSSPPPNSLIKLEVTAPSDLHVTLLARVGREVPGRGFLVTFEPESTSAQKALDDAVADPSFLAAREAESMDLVAPPVVTLLDDDGESTDPGFVLPGETFEPDEAKNTEPPDTDPAPRDPPQKASVPAPPAFSGRRPLPHAGQTVIRRAHPGEKYLAVVIRYPTVLGYLEDARSLEDTATLKLERPDREAQRNDPVLVRLILPGHNVYEIWSVVEFVDARTVHVRLDPNDEKFRRACLFPTSHQARNRREREERRGEQPHDHRGPGAGESRPPDSARQGSLRAPPADQRTVAWVLEEVPEADPEKMPLRRRIQRMGMEDKINLALSGNREERMALAQDSNKSIHHYLLKNAKLTIDEVAFMSRLPSMNPDVLDKIAENPGYTQNPGVTKALVFNPRTPVRTAIRLLDRLPRSELMVLSKRTGINKRLLMAAKTKVTGSKW